MDNKRKKVDLFFRKKKFFFSKFHSVFFHDILRIFFVFHAIPEWPSNVSKMTKLLLNYFVREKLKFSKNTAQCVYLITAEMHRVLQLNEHETKDQEFTINVRVRIEDSTRRYTRKTRARGSFAVNWTRSDDVAVRIVGHEITPISSRVVI